MRNELCRAYHYGLDALTGKDYEYRRQRVEDRILFLGEVFYIDILPMR